MFEAIGPQTWAVLACIGFMFLGSSLVNRGLVGAIIGIPVLSAAAGALVDIVFYEGTTFPVIGLPIGLVVALIVLGVSGAHIAINSHGTQSVSRGSIRDRMPHFGTSQIVTVVIGSVFVIVALVALGSRLDFKANNTSEGFAIASNKFDRQSNATMRRIERFLAR